jgi:hypothetical protein
MSVCCLAVLVFAAVLASCGDDIQKVAPPKRDAAERPNPHGQLPPGHPPMDGQPQQPPNPHAPRGSDGSDPFADAADAGKSIRGADSGPANDPEKVFYSGRVELDPSIKLPATYAVFVNAGLPPRGSPPVLSKKFADQPKFPLNFELRGKDMAFGDTKITGPLILYVILSESGVIEVGPQQLYVKTLLPEPQAPGSSNLVLTVKRP